MRFDGGPIGVILRAWDYMPTKEKVGWMLYAAAIVLIFWPWNPGDDGGDDRRPRRPDSGCPICKRILDTIPTGEPVR